MTLIFELKLIYTTMDKIYQFPKTILHFYDKANCYFNVDLILGNTYVRLGS